MRIAVALIAALTAAAILDLPPCYAGTPAPTAASSPDVYTEVKIRGEDFLLRLDSPSLEGDGRPIAKVLTAFPSELATEPQSDMSEDDILGEVEEHAWAAKIQYHRALSDEVESQVASSREDKALIERERREALRQGRGIGPSLHLQKLYDRQLALDLVVKGLRRALEYPALPPEGAEFTFPRATAKAPRERNLARMIQNRGTASALKGWLEANGYSTEEAYQTYRKVRSAYRAQDLAVLAAAVDYPFRLTDSKDIELVMETPDELLAATSLASSIFDREVREVVLKQRFTNLFVRDLGAMFGNGQIWITAKCQGQGEHQDCSQLALQHVSISGQLPCKQIRFKRGATSETVTGSLHYGKACYEMETTDGQTAKIKLNSDCDTVFWIEGLIDRQAAEHRKLAEHQFQTKAKSYRIFVHNPFNEGYCDAYDLEVSVK
jgi:hypothetical protein